MKNIIILFLLFFSIVSCDNKENKTQNYEVIETVKLNNKKDTIDYSLGVVIGVQMKKYGITDIDYVILTTAIKDVLDNNYDNLPIHPHVAKQIVSAYVKQTSDIKLVNENENNKTFLEKNKTNDEVILLESGLQYKILNEGTGNIPIITDNVTIHYKGRLVDGSLFVNTYNSIPVSFNISKSLKGWQEALTKMKVGSEWEVYLSPELAFGKVGSGSIPPNTVVIYQLKLLSIN